MEMCLNQQIKISCIFLVVKSVVVNVIISRTVLVRAIEEKPAVTKPTIAWVPVVIAKVRLVWISVHEPVPFEAVEVIHAERTTVVGSGVASVEVVVAVKTN